MKIDNLIKSCLTKGEIWIGVCKSSIVMTLKNNGDQLVVVSSTRGIAHLFLLFAGEVLKENKLIHFGNNKYKYPLNPSTISQNDHFLFQKRVIRIYLYGSVIQIDSHQIDMPNEASLPGIYYQRGRANTFSEALAKMFKSEPFYEPFMTNPT